jgi:hypothetical protein
LKWNFTAKIAQKISGRTNLGFKPFTSGINKGKTLSMPMQAEENDSGGVL